MRRTGRLHGMSESRPEPTGRVIVVSGPPGAGKTTVARLVADALPLSVHLHADDFWACIRRGVVAPYLPEARRQNEVVIAVLARAAFGYAAGGYDVLCDGVIGPWFVDDFRTTGSASAIALHYVVLRPDRTTTLHRAVSRTSADALTDPEPIDALHRQFADLGPLEPHVLDSTGLDAATTADAVLRDVARGRYRLG